MLLEKSKAGSIGQTKLNVPPPIDPLAGLLGAGGLDDGLLESLTTNDASDILGQVRINKVHELSSGIIITKYLSALNCKYQHILTLFSCKMNLAIHHPRI